MLSKQKLPDIVVIFLFAAIAVIFSRKFENIKDFLLNYRLSSSVSGLKGVLCFCVSFSYWVEFYIPICSVDSPQPCTFYSALYYFFNILTETKKCSKFNLLLNMEQVHVLISLLQHDKLAKNLVSFLLYHNYHPRNLRSDC